jgi:hypothetical protein
MYIRSLVMTVVSGIHFLRNVSPYFATPTVDKRLVKWYRGYINQQNVLIVEEKVEAFREIENWKKINGLVLVIWSCKFYDPNDL